MEREGFEPKIIGFCCHYCAFAAADLAGTMRLCYPSNIHIIRLPCTGKVDALYLLKAFEEGADGVFVAGCEEGSCHFVSGNIRAKRKVQHVKKLLSQIGIESERLEMFNLSSSMGERFAGLAREFTAKIKGLGPLFERAEEGVEVGAPTSRRRRDDRSRAETA